MSTRLSDDAVTGATGHEWDYWFSHLEEHGAKDLEHKDIVALLGNQGLVESSWWRQNITNEFEKKIGRRETGSTVDADFQIGVQKTLPVDAAAVWGLVTSAEGAREWLGIDGPAPTKPGETIVNRDGDTFELRTIKEGDRIRLCRTDGKTGDKSTVQVTVVPNKTGASLHFHQEGLNDADHREEMRSHWKTVADKLLGIV